MYHIIDDNTHIWNQMKFLCVVSIRLQWLHHRLLLVRGVGEDCRLWSSPIMIVSPYHHWKKAWDVHYSRTANWVHSNILIMKICTEGIMICNFLGNRVIFLDIILFLSQTQDIKTNGGFAHSERKTQYWEQKHKDNFSGESENC